MLTIEGFEQGGELQRGAGRLHDASTGCSAATARPG